MNLRLIDIAVILALLFAIFSWFWAKSERELLNKVNKETLLVISKVDETLALKRFWSGKGIKERILRIKNSIPNSMLKSFTIKRRQVKMRVVNLDAKRLNSLIKAIGRLPIQIKSLNIKKQDKSYILECSCKW